MKTYNLKVTEYGGIAKVKAEFPDEITWNRSQVYDNTYNYWTIVDAEKYREIIDYGLFGLYIVDLLDKILIVYEEVIGPDSLPIKSESEYESDAEILRNYVCITFTKNYKIASITRIIDMTDPLNSWGNKVISIHLHMLVNEKELFSIEESNLDSILDFKSNEMTEVTRRLFYGDKAEKIWSEGMSIVLSRLQYRYNPSIITGDLMIDPGINEGDSVDDVVDKLIKLNKHL